MGEGLAASRTKAQALIRAAQVLVDDVPIDKPGTKVAEDAVIRLRGVASPFVSRGGEKLAGAFDDLHIDPSGKLCLDVGASTGGFTDCLLQRGASGVVALDVGYGQLHEKLRQDPRVTLIERVNARELGASLLPEGVGLVTMDVSFISSTLILPRLAEVVPAADLLIMVKPQFEVGREEVGKGGVVRDEVLRARAAERVQHCAEALGYDLSGQSDSQIPGPKGNREIFLYLRPSGSGRRG